jgi:[acyl-carrier-protein] S-malonyltransferase
MSIDNFKPDMVAGHSLGEFTALVCNQTLKYEDALKLVSIRANAMQKACVSNPSTMAAVLGMEDAQVDAICQSITNEVVVAANYNCPGQLVISGSMEGVALASEKLKEAGAKRVLPLKVGGAFHSPLMQPAQDELAEAIRNTQ